MGRWLTRVRLRLLPPLRQAARRQRLPSQPALLPPQQRLDQMDLQLMLKQHKLPEQLPELQWSQVVGQQLTPGPPRLQPASQQAALMLTQRWPLVLLRELL